LSFGPGLSSLGQHACSSAIAPRPGSKLREVKSAI
jgi:hypothetical protein